MSRLATRVILTLVVSLIILAAVFVSVRAVSASAQKGSLGMYMLSGGLSNPLQSQSVQSQTAPQPAQSSYPDYEGGGHGGCESEGRVNPEE